MEKRNYGGRVTLQCEKCGVEFTRKASRIKPHIFCSKQCYLQSEIHGLQVANANRRRHPSGLRREMPCLRCVKPVVRWGSQVAGQNFCSRDCMYAYAIEHPVRQITQSGYVKVYVGKGAAGADVSGHIPEHRHVMQQHLGRALLPTESVHHINGVRTDNRLDNLELWSKSHPSGQRVVDKVAWAKEIIAMYEGLLIE